MKKERSLIAALNGGDFYPTHRMASADGVTTYSNRPLFCILVFEDASAAAFPPGVVLLPVAWNFATKAFIDPSTDPTFIGYGMSKLIEPHYQADAADLRMALSEFTHVTPEQLKGLLHTQLAQTFTRMIADKIVRDVLARKVAP